LARATIQLKLLTVGFARFRPWASIALVCAVVGCDIEPSLPDRGLLGTDPTRRYPDAEAMAMETGAPDLGADAGFASDADAGFDEDVGIPDVGFADVGFPDVGFPDVGFPDAGFPDVGFPDVGFPDAGFPDAGFPDVGFPDAGFPDVGFPDVGFPDAGFPDAGFPDVGFPDAGFFPDATPVDAGLEPLGPLGPGVATLTGASEPGEVDGPRGFARLNNPVNVLHTELGLFVADFYNDRLVLVTDTGSVATVVRIAGFRRPFGLVRTSSRTLLIESDRDPINDPTGALWSYDLEQRQATLVALRIRRPRGLVLTDDGRLIGADYQAHELYFIDPLTGLETPLAGTATAGYAEGLGTAARFNEPCDIVQTSSTTFLVADRDNNRIRQVSLNGEVSTFAGDGTFGQLDGPRLSAQFANPQALAIDGAGNIYVADGGSFTIRRIDPSGEVTTIAGTGTLGETDDLDPLAASFRGLEGLDVSLDGRYLYIADGARGQIEPYNRIRRLQLR